MSTDTPYSTSPGSKVTLSEWNEAYDLYTPLLSLKYRMYDPIEVLRGFREGVDALPKTAATVRLSDLENHLPFDAVAIGHMAELIEVTGGWRLNGNSDSRGIRFVNPNYVHRKALEPNIQDPDRRRDVLQRCAGYGVLTLEDVAPRFGITNGSLKRWLSRKNIPWTEWRHDGIKRLARTCHTISAWRVHSENELADVLGVPRGTLSRWIHKFARTTDFEPPSDPSYEPWFTLTAWAEERDRNRGGSGG